MNVASERLQAQLKRKVRVRRKVLGTSERPRLCVFRSAKHIYAQIIEDVTGTTLVAVSSLNGDLVSGYTGNIEAAKAVGSAIAKKAMSLGGYTDSNMRQAAQDSSSLHNAGKTSTVDQTKAVQHYGGWH